MSPKAAHETLLQDLLRNVVSSTGVPGIGVALSVDGQRTWAFAGTATVGRDPPLSADSRFQIGCITKMLVSLVALELAAGGALDPEAPIGDYLPALGGTPRGREVLIRHLLSHTSGYQGLSLSDPEVGYYYSWEKFLKVLREGPQHFRPGAVFNYEHTECVVLGRILECVTGCSPRQLLQERILAPLGIRSGTIRDDVADPNVHVSDHIAGATEQYTPVKAVPYCAFWEASLSDLTLDLPGLLRIGEQLIDRPSDAVFNPSAVQRLREQAAYLPDFVGGSRKEELPVSFGFGCARYSGGELGHNGSARGQTCALRFDPARRLVVVVAMNCWQPFLRDTLVARIFAVLGGASGTTPAARPAMNVDLAELSGRYAGARETSVELKSEGGSLSGELRERTRASGIRLTLSRTQEGLRLETSVPHLSVGFFRDPSSLEPGLMLGLNAYRKVA